MEPEVLLLFAPAVVAEDEAPAEGCGEGEENNKAEVSVTEGGLDMN